MTTAMTRTERERFLMETRVGLLAVPEPDSGPLVVPVWYEYTSAEGIRFVSVATARKTILLRAAGRAGFCVQTETWPYRYVSVEGPIATSRVTYDRDVRDMALRYLGEERGRPFLSRLETELEGTESLLVTIRPERWRTIDYSKAGT